MGKGLAEIELVGTPGPATGGRRGGLREPLLQCSVVPSLPLALRVGCAPAHCGGPTWRPPRRSLVTRLPPKPGVRLFLPTFQATAALWAGVAQTSLWNFRGLGGRGKHGKTWAREVCKQRGQLVGGWKFRLPLGKSRRFLPPHRHTHTTVGRCEARLWGIASTLVKRKYKA